MPNTGATRQQPLRLHLPTHGCDIPTPNIHTTMLDGPQLPPRPSHLMGATYREYNPDSIGTRRDECLVGDSRRQVLVDGDKDIEVVQK